MPLAGQVHACVHCGRRLPIDNVVGQLIAICPKCKGPTVVQVIIQTSREVC